MFGTSLDTARHAGCNGEHGFAAPAGYHIRPALRFTLPGERKPALLRAAVVEALRGIHDPEIPLNIYDLGLVYALDISDDGNIHIRMTLSTPACAAVHAMPGRVERAVCAVPGVRSARVELVWEPAWQRERTMAASPANTCQRGMAGN